MANAQPTPQQPNPVETVQAVQFVDFATFLTQDENKQKENKAMNEAQHQDRMKLQLESLARQLADAQARRVPPCDGSDAAAVRAWLREVDLTLPYTDRTIYIASQSATGPLRRELEHFMSSQPDRNNVSWDSLAKHLASAFLSPHEEDRLRHEVSKIKRGAYETTASFGRRFREAADLAYPPKTITTSQGVTSRVRNPDQDRILLEAYMRGLSDAALVKRLIEEAHPTTFDAAMFQVTQYEADRYRLNMAMERGLLSDRHEELMEIGAVQKAPQAPEDSHKALADLRRQVSGLATQFTKLVAIMEQQAAPSRSATAAPRQNRPQQSHRSAPQYNYRFTDTGRPICHYCNKVGHIAKE
jgi:hypothetical protein